MSSLIYLSDLLRSLSREGRKHNNATPITVMNNFAKAHKLGVSFNSFIPVYMRLIDAAIDEIDRVSEIPSSKKLKMRSKVASTRKLITLCIEKEKWSEVCLLYTSPSPRDGLLSRMPSSA